MHCENSPAGAKIRTSFVPGLHFSDSRDYQALDQNYHLMEYARASMHAENARLNLSIPC
jgi:hypothetical protein